MTTQSHALSVKKGVKVEMTSIIWMIIEAAVAIGSGIVAHSLSLVAFGADSIIELVAGSVLLWRLMIEARGASLERVKKGGKGFILGRRHCVAIIGCLYRDCLVV